MRKIYTLLFWSFCHLPILWSQAVWPGDVNNNGQVSGVDVLYWGLAHGSEGPARVVQSTDWSPQTPPSPWGSTFPNGIDYAYADCNGDGVVDEDDFSEAIEDNFALEHLPQGAADTYANATGEAPRLKLTPDANLVEPGAMVNIDLSFDPSAPVPPKFYGLALKLSYSTGLIEGDDGPDFELIENSWIEVDGSYVEEIYVEEDELGTAELAITRTNQISALGSTNSFGSFSIIVEDIIVGLEVDTFLLRIDSVLLIDEQFTVLPVVPDTARILIAHDTSKLTSALESQLLPGEERQIAVYPNPAQDWIQIYCPFQLEQLRLIDPYGRIIILRPSLRATHTYAIALPSLPPSTYWLQLRTEAGVFTRKLVLTPD